MECHASYEAGVDASDDYHVVLFAYDVTQM